MIWVSYLPLVSVCHVCLLCMLMSYEVTRSVICAGHEDDLVIELANEVRKVLGIVGNVIPTDKKTIGPAQLAHPSRVPVSPLQLHPLPKPIA